MGILDAIYDYESDDLTTEKKKSVSKASEEKKAVLDPSWNKVPYYSDSFGDADDLGGSRLTTNAAGISYDAFENKDYGLKKNPKKRKQQSEAAAKYLDKPVEEVTNQDIFDLGNASINKLKSSLLDGYSNVPTGTPGLVGDTDIPQPFYETKALAGQDLSGGGRQLVEGRNAYTGKDLIESMNTPEHNANYDTGYNILGRTDQERAFGESATDLGATVIGKGTAMTGQALKGVLKGVPNILSAMEGNVREAWDLPSKPSDRFIRPEGIQTLMDNTADIAVKAAGLLGEDVAANMESLIENPIEHIEKINMSKEFQAEKRRSAAQNRAKERSRTTKSYKEYKKGADRGITDVVGPIVDEFTDYIGTLGDNPLVATDVALSSTASMVNAGLLGKSFANSAVNKLVKKDIKNNGGIETKKMSPTELKAHTAKVTERFKETKTGKELQQSAGEKGALAYTGISEGSSNAEQVYTDIVSKDYETLYRDSKPFRDMVDSGEYTREEARNTLAYTGYTNTLTTTGLFAAGVSKITGASKVEGGLLQKGKLATAKDRLTASTVPVIREGVEETIQSGGGQLIGNVIQKNILEDKSDISEGVIQSAAEGLVGGIGSTAVTQVPKAAIDSIRTGNDLRNVLGATNENIIKPLNKAKEKIVSSTEKSINKAHTKTMDSGTPTEKADSLLKVGERKIEDTPEAISAFVDQATLIAGELQEELKENNYAKDSTEYKDIKETLGKLGKKVKKLNTQEANRATNNLRTGKSEDIAGDTTKVVNDIRSRNLGNEDISEVEFTNYQDESMPTEVREAAKQAQEIQTLKNSSEVRDEVINDINEYTQDVMDAFSTTEDKTVASQKAKADFTRLKNNQVDKIKVLEDGLANYDAKDPSTHFVIYPATRKNDDATIQTLVEQADAGNIAAMAQLKKDSLAATINPLKGKGTDKLIESVKKESEYIGKLAGQLNNHIKQAKIDARVDSTPTTESKPDSFSAMSQTDLKTRIDTLITKGNDKGLTKKEISDLNRMKELYTPTESESTTTTEENDMFSDMDKETATSSTETVSNTTSDTTPSDTTISQKEAENTQDTVPQSQKDLLSLAKDLRKAKVEFSPNVKKALNQIREGKPLTELQEKNLTTWMNKHEIQTSDDPMFDNMDFDVPPTTEIPDSVQDTVDDDGSSMFDDIDPEEGTDTDINNVSSPLVSPNQGKTKTADKYELFPDVYANEDQTNAIDKLVAWGKDTSSKLFVLSGRGGTGKTTVIGKAVEEMGLKPHEVVFALPTHKAKAIIENSAEKFDNFSTVASLLGTRKKKGKFEVDRDAFETSIEENKDKKLIVIDEASMISANQVEYLNDFLDSLNNLNPNATPVKVIFMGDNVQLPPVDNSNKDAVKISPVFSSISGFTEELSENITESNGAILKQRMRQSNTSPILNITDVFSDAVEYIYDKFSNNKEVAEPNIILDGKNLKVDGSEVAYEKNNEATIDKFIEDYVGNELKVKWINFSNAGKDASKSIRNSIRSKLFPNEKDAENVDARPYIKGEYVMAGESTVIYTPEGELSSSVLHNGDEFIVLEEPRNIEIDIPVTRQMTLKNIPVQIMKVQKGDEEYDIILEIVKEVWGTNQWGNPEVDNLPGSTRKALEDGVVKAGKKKGYAFYIADGKVSSRDIGAGYIINTHKAQGSTYETVYVDYENIVNNSTNAGTWVDKLRSLYVATSRPTTKLVMVGNKPTKADGRVQLGTGKTVNDLLGQHIPTEAKEPVQEESQSIKDILGEIGDVMSSTLRANFSPEEKKKLLPLFVKLAEALIKEGVTKAKELKDRIFANVAHIGNETEVKDLIDEAIQSTTKKGVDDSQESSDDIVNDINSSREQEEKDVYEESQGNVVEKKEIKDTSESANYKNNAQVAQISGDTNPVAARYSGTLLRMQRDFNTYVESLDLSKEDKAKAIKYISNQVTKELANTNNDTASVEASVNRVANVINRGYEKHGYPSSMGMFTNNTNNHKGGTAKNPVKDDKGKVKQNAITSSSLKQTVTQKSKVAASVLGMIPNFLDIFITQPVNRNAVLKGLGITPTQQKSFNNNVRDFVNEFTEVLDTKVNPAFKPLENTTTKPTERSIRTFFKDPTLLFQSSPYVDSSIQKIKGLTGITPSNIASAMAIVAFNYLGTKASSSNVNSPKQINRMLNRHPDATIPDDLLILLSNAGVPRGDLIAELGKAVLDQLNLKAHNNLDDAIQQNLVNAYGLRVLETLNKMDDKDGSPKYISITKLPKGEIDYKDENGYETSSESLVFVSTATEYVETDESNVDADGFVDYEGFFKNSPELDKIKNYMVGDTNEGTDVFNAMFNLKSDFQLPPSEPVEQINKSLKGTINKIDSVHEAAAVEQQKYHWTPKKGMSGLFNLIPENLDQSKAVLLARMFGYNPDIENTVHIEDRESEKAKNMQIISSLGNINKFLSERGIAGVFYDMIETYKTTRMGYANAGLDMQQDKVVRHFFRGENFEHSLDLSGKELTEDQFHINMATYYSILEGMGEKADEMTLDGVDGTPVIKDEFTKLIAEVQHGKYKPLYEAYSSRLDKNTGEYLSNATPFNQSEYNSLIDAINEADEGAVSVDSLETLMRITFAQNNNIDNLTIDIGAEIDGKTNGYAIVLLQWMDDFNAENKDSLNRSGVYFDDSSVTSYAEYKNLPGALDNYQAGAKRASNEFTNLTDNIQELMELGDESNMPELQNIISTLMPFFASSNDAGASQGEKLISNFLRKPYKSTSEKEGRVDFLKSSKNRAAIMAAVQERVDIIQQVIPNFFSEKVDGALRQLMKEPHMRGQYGQSKKSAIDTVSESLYAAFKNKLMDIRSSKKLTLKEKQTAIEDLSRLFAPKGNNILGKQSQGKIKDYRLDTKGSSLKSNNKYDKETKTSTKLPNSSLKEVFDSMVGMLAGEPVAEAMDKLLAEPSVHRERMVQAVKMMSVMEAYAYEKYVAEWRKEKGNAGKLPNATVRRKILIKMRDAGLQSSIATPNSKGLDEYITLTEFEKAPINTDNSDYKTQTTFTEAATVTDLGIDSETGKLKETDTTSTVDSFTAGIRSNKVIPIQSIGSAVFAIFGVDSTIQAIAMNQGMHMLNVHDAIFSDVLSIIKLAMKNNESYIDINENFRFMEAIDTRLNDYINSFEDKYGKIDGELGQSLNNLSDEYYNDRNDFQFSISGKEDGLFTEDLTDLVDTLLPKSVVETNAAMDKVMAVIKYINQYVTPFSKTGPQQNILNLSDEKLVNEVENETKENLGNQSQTSKLADIMRDTYEGDPLGAETANKLFEDLSKTQGKIEDADHLSRLKDVLNKLIVPALKASNTVHKVIRGTVQGAKNLGEYDPMESALYLADAEGINTGEGMSPQETAIHEWSHAITLHGLEDPDNYLIKRRLLRLFKDTKNSLQDKYGDSAYEVFLDKDSNGNPVFLVNEAQERKVAEARYNYIFNNPNGYHLEEFMAFGLSNAKLIAELSTFKPKTKRDTKLFSGGNVFEELGKIFSNIIDWITNKIYNSRNKTSDVYLQNLVKDLTKIQSARVKQVGNAAQLVSRVNTVTQREVVDRMGRVWRKASEKVSTEKLSKKGTLGAMVSLAINIPMLISQQDYRKMMDDTAYKYGLNKTNLMYKLLNTEFLKTKEDNQVWEDMLRNSKHILDKARNETMIATSNSILDAYDKDDKPDKNESMAITLGILKTDLDSLMDSFSMEEIVNFYVKDASRKKQIAKYEADIDTLGKESNYYKTLGKSLGRMMITGKASMRGQSLNAYNIANLSALKTPYKDDEKNIIKMNITTPPSNPKKAEEILEKLITLYAIDSLTKSTRRTVGKRVNKEYKRNSTYNGIAMTLGVHRKVKEDAKDSIFKGNKALFIKGYTKEQFDPNIDFKIGTDADDFTHLGYKRLNSPLARDDKAPSSLKQQYMWVNNNAMVNTTISGIMGKVSMQNKGNNVVNLLANQGETGIPAYAKSYKIANKIHKDARKDLIAAYKGELDLDTESTFMVPIPGVDGSATGYRYMMDEVTKNSLLNKQDLAHKVLGNMAGNILDKVATKKIGSDVLKQAKAEYDLIGQTQGREFTYIGKTATDPKYSEMWASLPKDVRKEMKKQWGEDGMYIRTELLDMVFGYRKFSLGDMKVFKSRLINVSVRTAESVLQDIVKLAKSKIVLLTPDVLKGNVISNNMILMVSGVPIKNIVRDSQIAITALNEHRDTKLKMDKLQIRYDVSKDKLSASQKTNIEDRLLKYKTAIETNPVNELIDKGLFQSIVEDIDIDTSSYIKSRLETGKFTKNIFNKYDESDNIAKKAFQQLTIDQTTDSYSVLMKATQYSDFVARYTLYQHQTKMLGMSKEESVKDIMSTFINYDLPQTKELQYINDMGWLMYTKFLFRIQRIIWKMWLDKPASVLASLGIQEILGDTADITDSLLTPNGVYDRFDFNPLSQIDDATDLSSMNYLLYFM